MCMTTTCTLILTSGSIAEILFQLRLREALSLLSSFTSRHVECLTVNLGDPSDCSVVLMVVCPLPHSRTVTFQVRFPAAYHAWVSGARVRGFSLATPARVRRQLRGTVWGPRSEPPLRARPASA